MEQFLLFFVLLSASSLCSCDHHYHPPPFRGFRPVPPPGYRPSFGPPRGPPRGSYNRPSNRPPVGSYRPYWPKAPSQGSYDYQSQGYKDDNQFQSLGLGNPGTSEATVSSYFPVSSDSYTPSYDDHSYPMSQGGYSHYNHRRPPYKPAFNPSEQIFTGPDDYSRPPTSMVPPAFLGQGPDYSSPMYSQTPANLAPIFPNQPTDYSPSTGSNQPPGNLAPVFPYQPFAPGPSQPNPPNQPDQNQFFLEGPQDVPTTSTPPPNLAPIFDFAPGPNVLVDLDPKFPKQPSFSSPIDYWLPSASIPSGSTTTTTTTTTVPPFRLFSMNSTTTTANPPFRQFSMDTASTTTTAYPPFILFSFDTTSTTSTASPPFRQFPMETTSTATTFPPFRLFSMNTSRTTTTTLSPVPARTFPPTVAPVYNNSLAVNNVTVVVADDDVFDRVYLDNSNCSNVFPLSESDELLLSFNFAATLTGRCVLTFTGPSGGLKVALQISNVTLMKDNGTKVDCEKQSLGVFSHKAGNLFKMEQLCGLERNSAVLLTDSQSPLITLTFVNQPPTKDNAAPFNVSFNMQLFTYALQSNATTWP